MTDDQSHTITPRKPLVVQDVFQIQAFDSYDLVKAKQQASVLWLMSKAYNNSIPGNLLDPYYRDHEGQDQLKPHIVHALANAELYCLALGNIYADQNHHSLNHNGVMMLLQRKGVYVVEPADVSLTETVLVQVAPIRMTAHMAVIEAVMALYIKEVLIPDRIIQCVKKFVSLPAGSEFPVDPEDAIVFWMNKSCEKMKHRIFHEMETSPSSDGSKQSKLPHIPIIQDLSDLSDGCSLSLLLSLYCPDHFSWKDICLSDSLSLADSLYNLQLVQRFCEEVLPFNFHFLSLEDVLYMHSSIRQNILAFLADLFHALEVKPVKCVKPPGYKDSKIKVPALKPKSSENQVAAGIQSSKQIPSPIPDLRNTSHTYEFNYMSQKSPIQKDGSLPRNGKFKSPITPEAYSRGFKQSGSEFNSENGEHRSTMLEDGPSSLEAIPAAGISSKIKRMDDSLIPARLKVAKEKNHKESKVLERGESPDKTKNSGLIGEADIFLTSITGSPRRAVPNNAPMSSNLDGIPGFKSPNAESQNRTILMPGDSPFKLGSNDSSSNQFASKIDSNIIHSNFAEMAKNKEANLGINVSLSYDLDKKNAVPPAVKPNLVKKDAEKVDSPKPVKKTSFAAVPSNTTTWQQQVANSQVQLDEDEAKLEEGGDNDVVLTSQLNNIRMELEEKRRNIELEKKKLELMWDKQRQKVGKAAFLQAVSKNPLKNKSAEGENAKVEAELNKRNEEKDRPEELQRPAENDAVQKGFRASIGQLSESLSDLQVDISKLTKQQEMIQNIVTTQQTKPDSPAQQNFYLHDQNQNHSPAFSQGLMKSATMPPMKTPMVQQLEDPSTRGYPQQIGPSAYSMPPYQHQRGQWGARPIAHDLTAPSTQRGQWNQLPPQQDPNISIRQPWYLPQQPNAPIMSTGQYPISYNQEFMPHTQQVPYSMYQNGQRVDGSPQHVYNSSQYHQPPSTIYPSYHSQPPVIDPVYPAPRPQQQLPPQHQPLQSMTFRLRDHQDVAKEPIVNMSSDNPVAPPSNQVPQNPVASLNQVVSSNNVLATSKETNQQTTHIDQPLSSKVDGKHAIGKTFRVQKPKVSSPTTKEVVSQPYSDEEELPELPTQPIKDGTDNDLGFFVSFDEQPVKPKPKLRAKSAGATKSPTSSKEVDRPKYDPNPFRSSSTLTKSSPKYDPNPFQSKASTISDKSSPLRHLNEPKIQAAMDPNLPSQVPISHPHASNDEPKNESTAEPGDEEAGSGVGFIIGADLVNPDPVAEDEMQKRKERIMMISLQRKAKQEEMRALRERENAKVREQEQMKKEEIERKKEEEKMRRQIIYEQYKQRKQSEAEEAEGRNPNSGPPPSASRTFTKPRSRSAKQRPKSQFVHPANEYPSPPMMSSKSSIRGSQPNLSAFDDGTYDERDNNVRISSRRAMSPPPGSSLLGGYYGRGGPPSEASDTCSTTGSVMDYAGPRLFVKPTSKSNRGIVLNAVNTVLAGHVNADAKRHALDEMNKSDSKHFVILFRDEGLKFRSIYSYNPDREEVLRLYGTGPKQITDKMLDKFYKYNSGTKSFSEIHTKHLTVTIDAITIQNSLWQGKSHKKAPPRRDFFR